MIFEGILKEETVETRGGNIQTDFFGEALDATHLVSRSEISQGGRVGRQKMAGTNQTRAGPVLHHDRYAYPNGAQRGSSTCSLSKYELISVLKLLFARLKRVTAVSSDVAYQVAP
jgi:hypothetical protein